MDSDRPRDEERDLLERLTLGVEFARLVIGILVERGGGEVRISRDEIDRFSRELDVAQYLDEATGELILTLESAAPDRLEQALRKVVPGTRRPDAD